MSKEGGDLFGDSSDDADTDDLLATAAAAKPIAKKKKEASGSSKPKAKKKIPDADNDDDSDDDFDTTKKNDAGGGLFDSSDEDDDDNNKSGKNNNAAPKKLGNKKNNNKKRKASSSSNTKTASKNKQPLKEKAAAAAAAAPSKKDKMSMKERMEALAKKRHADSTTAAAPTSADAAEGDAKKSEPKKKRSKTTGPNGEKLQKGDDGYESGDSYDSLNFERTREDDDFIDADDEDPDALRELYAEQHFEDERPSGSDSENDEEGGKKKKKSMANKRKGGGGAGLDKLSDDEGDIDEKADATSALKAAVGRMKQKKKVVKKLNELEEEAREFLGKMDAAADADEESIAERRPATKKLAMLPQVMDMLAKKDMVRPLLDLDLLSVVKRWVQPLPNGSLGNNTLRHRIMECISTLTGDTGINAGDLKRSGFGKTVMTLYMHKSETPSMKKLLKDTIEAWSRPIFQKSGNMRDLERVQATRGRNESGLVGIARAQSQMDTQRNKKSNVANAGTGRGRDAEDVNNIISGSAKSSQDLGNNRVRIPYSKGFQFSVRPMDRMGDVGDKRNLVSASKDGGDKRADLSKRLKDRQRPTNKQGSRSANISIEGRPTK